MEELIRMKKLVGIAGKDEIYQGWSRDYAAFRADFTRFADAQPKEIRNFLWGYAESGRLVYQRLVNLACEQMVFPEEIGLAPKADV